MKKDEQEQRKTAEKKSYIAHSVAAGYRNKNTSWLLSRIDSTQDVCLPFNSWIRMLMNEYKYVRANQGRPHKKEVTSLLCNCSNKKILLMKLWSIE